MPKDTLSSARELFHAGHFAGVVAVCSDALRRDQRNISALLQRAGAWIELFQPDQAIEDLREVLALDPRNGAAYRALGRLLVHRGDLDGASEMFVSALRVDREDVEAQEELFGAEVELAIEELIEETSAAHAMSRMPTVIMEEKAGLEAAWRAPTSPIAREASRALPRAPTVPMERGGAQVASWRAPTLPLMAPDARDRRHVGGRALTEDPQDAIPRTISQRTPSGPCEAASRSSRHRVATVPMERDSTSLAHRRTATNPAHRHPAAALPYRRAATAPLPRSAGADLHPVASSRHDDRSSQLVDSLLSAGLLTPEALQTARAHQRVVGGELAEVLLELGYVSLQELERVRSL